MKCPHCRSDIGSRVTLTRHADGCVYRRRTCRCCAKSHATEERSIERMPTGLDRIYKAKHKGAA